MLSCLQHSRSYLCIGFQRSRIHLPALPSLSAVYATDTCDGPLRPSRYYAGSDFHAPSLSAWISPLQTPHLLDVPSSNTWRCPHIALAAIPAYAVCSRLRLGSADSPQHSAESGSLSYGPPVRLRLLSTLPHGNAVTFDYKVMACLDADFHRADKMPSRAHGSRPTPGRQDDESIQTQSNA